MRHPEMPFVVSQANAINTYPISTFFAAFFFFFMRLLPEPTGVGWGLGLAFVPLAAGFAFGPFNPFREAGTHRRPFERRVLVAFYDPANRRRAVMALSAFFLVLLCLWPLARRFPSSIVSTLPVPHVAVCTFALSVVGALWVGLFGLTLSIREHWSTISERGALWPEGLRYPGSVGACVASFFTGHFPPFLPAEGPRDPGVESAS